MNLVKYFYLIVLTLFHFREISVGIPDVKARQMILDVLFRGLRIDSAIDAASLAKLTPGFVGSDLESLVTIATNNAHQRHFMTRSEKYRR